MTRSVLLLALVACGTQDAAPKRDKAAKQAEPAPHKLDTLEMALPLNWSTTYLADNDRWQLNVPLADGTLGSGWIERAPTNAVAGPDAYLAQRRKAWPADTQAVIESRKGVKDGFALTVVVTPAGQSAHRETYVVRQLGSVYYQCVAEAVVDDAMRDNLIALCKSIKL